MSTATRPVSTPAAAPPSPALTPIFVRLKLSLLKNGLRQSPGRTAAYVISMAVTLLFAAGLLLGLILLRGVSGAPALAVLLTAILTLGWAAMPLFFPTADETMDPTRLVMLPLRPRPLIGSLLIASLIGVGPVFTVVLAAGSVVAVARGAAAVVVGVVATVLIVLVCAALARAVATANVRLLTSRRGRDLAVLSGLFVALGAQGVNLAAQKLAQSQGLTALEPAAAVLRWIPPASAVDAVDAAGRGAYGRAAFGLAVTALALVALLWWWSRTLTTVMTSPDSSTLQAIEKDSGRKRDGRAGGWERLLPDGRTGTVMRRTLLYGWRDPKTKMGWAAALGVGLILPVVTALQGGGSVYTACWAAGLLGLQMYNQFGQDTSAFWMVASTLATRRDAFLELAGRALAVAVIAVPYVTVVVLGSAALLDDWAAFPEVYGVALALLGALVATGAFASVRFPYSIPSDGNKNVAPGQGGIAWISMLVGVIMGGLLCLPVIGLTVALHVAGLQGLLWLVLPVGAVYGAVVAVLGLRLTAPGVLRRLPEILVAVSKG
ncbi:transporter [Streptomyces purpurogeneiscleroticus]|uniref:transporter n=1 Tax=Streptomyces purpurogeneiscleroticus TaxID=68259 RepID=UPI001CBB331D|nr:transporter [Streptomyces purpurogeneiscleroticus]MBZ4018184.1 transporter [Streptomyces purpurogeneiscleroticus]